MIPILAELAYNALSDKDKNRFKFEYPIILESLQCCEHQNTCSLHSLKCCSCSDKRKFSEVYKYYSDGEGMVETHDRNLHYCPKCKFNNIKNLEPPKNLRRSNRLRGCIIVTK